VIDEHLKLHKQRHVNGENDFEISQLGAFATPGLHLAHRPGGLTTEYGLDESLAGRYPEVLGGVIAGDADDHE
jgi:hypothetical protein